MILLKSMWLALISQKVGDFLGRNVKFVDNEFVIDVRTDIEKEFYLYL